MDILQKIKEQGWYLTEEGLEKISQNIDKNDVKKVIQAAMDMDLKEIAGGALPSEISRKEDYMPGKIVLQIAKVRNISAPKANEESKAAPRFLHLELTDGTSQIIGLEFEHISSISLNTPPGTKIYLRNEKIQLMQGNVVLRPNDIHVLGGKVPALLEKWEMSRALLKYAKGGRINSGSTGPPPWTPFGQKIQQNVGDDKNFKSLNPDKDKDKDDKENNEFVAMRNEAIAEAAKVGSKKVFGGGNLQLADHNVKKIMEKGYTEEQATYALKLNRNNLERALYNLKRREDFKAKEEDKTRGPKGRGPKDSRRSKDEESTISTKPAGNVSLFDFLTDKLPAKEGSQERSVPSYENNSLHKQSEHSTRSSYKTESSRPVYQNRRDESHYSASKSSNHNFQQQQHQHEQQSNNSIPSQSNRPKFENNISSSFANRSSESDVSYRNRNPSNARAGSVGNNSNYNSYPPPRQYQQQQQHHQQNDYQNQSERYRGGTDGRQPNNPRNQRTNERTNNYQSSQSQQQQHQPPNNSNYESRNRNEGRGYEKGQRPNNSSSRYTQREPFNQNNSSSGYQQANKNYSSSENRSSNSYNASKINKLVDETSKLKIDSPNLRHGAVSASSSQPLQPPVRNHSVHQSQQPTSQPPKPTTTTTALHHQKSQPAQQLHQQPPPPQISTAPISFTQLPNGFAYDPNKIVGFQSKEANDFALSMLKSQNINTSIPPPQAPTATLVPASHTQFAAPPPTVQPAIAIAHAPPQAYPAAQFLMQPPPTGTFGFAQCPTGADGWNWKIGDRCLAKYWDDGQYYEAEITGLSDKTCVVLYLAYGNHEEVLKADCLPITDAHHRPINFSKMNEIAVMQPTGAATYGPAMHPHHSLQQHHHLGGPNRGIPHRYRGERQVYVPPPKRDG